MPKPPAIPEPKKTIYLNQSGKNTSLIIPRCPRPNCNYSKKLRVLARNYCPELQGGTRELSKTYFENIPIPPINDANRDIANRLETLTDSIITAKQQNPDVDIQTHESEINALIYQLYKLTPDEISIIEA